MQRRTTRGTHLGRAVRCIRTVRAAFPPPSPFTTPPTAVPATLPLPALLFVAHLVATLAMVGVI